MLLLVAQININTISQSGSKTEVEFNAVNTAMIRRYTSALILSAVTAAAAAAAVVA